MESTGSGITIDCINSDNSISILRLSIMSACGRHKSKWQFLKLLCFSLPLLPPLMMQPQTIIKEQSINRTFWRRLKVVLPSLPFSLFLPLHFLYTVCLHFPCDGRAFRFEIYSSLCKSDLGCHHDNSTQSFFGDILFEWIVIGPWDVFTHKYFTTVGISGNGFCFFFSFFWRAFQGAAL